MKFTPESQYSCECMAFFMPGFQSIYYFAENKTYSEGV
jgi:hypothetical protein